MEIGYLIFCPLFQKLSHWYKFILTRRIPITGAFSSPILWTVSFPPSSLLHLLLQPIFKLGFFAFLPSQLLAPFLPLRANSQQPSNKWLHFPLTFGVFTFSITFKLTECTVHLLLPLTALNSLQLVSKRLIPNESCYRQGLLADGETDKPVYVLKRSLRISEILSPICPTRSHRLASSPQYSREDLPFLDNADQCFSITFCVNLLFSWTSLSLRFYEHISFLIRPPHLIGFPIWGV